MPAVHYALSQPVALHGAGEADNVTTFQKQSGPVTFLANYTFGKVLGIRDGVSQNGASAGNMVDPFSTKVNYGVLAYDHTHIFNAYSYVIERRASAVTYTVTDGRDTISLPLHYAFGVGSQTFVLERDGRLYESFVSYYPVIDALDVTMGDQQLKPKTLPDAIGRDVTGTEAASCFGCHSTGAVVNKQLDLASMVPGVRCEHCHLGASQHLEAISHGKLDSVPPKLKQLSSEDLSNFRGQCHRSWETVVRNKWQGEIDVRFQPYRLANSKCFDGVDRRMSCIVCHDPHREIVRDDKTYDAKCLACHSADAKPSLGMLAMNPGEPPVQIKMKTCPVSKSACVGCHMPRVQLPGGHMIFADHQIRVMRAGDPYPN